MSAYLHTAKQWADFETFFRPHDRMRRGALVQVMHHGAKDNWQPGLAAKFDPLASIFCSNPAGPLQHPSPKVLSDFTPFSPKQIDAFHGLVISGCYGFA